MLIEDPKIVRAICQIDYDNSLKFLSEKGHLAHEFMKRHDYTEFTVSGTQSSVSLRNTDQKRWLIIGISQSRMLWNSPGVFDNFKNPAAQTCQKILEDLDQPVLNRIGVRLIRLAIIRDANFEQIVEAMNGAFLTPGFIATLRFANNSPNDVAHVFEYRLDHGNGHVEIGPLTRDEVVKKFEEDEENAPELSLQIDVDYSIVRRSKSDKLPSIAKVLQDSYTESLEFTRGILSLLK